MAISDRIFATCKTANVKMILTWLEHFWKYNMPPPATWNAIARGGVEDTRLEAKDTKKNPRPRTAFPRTDPLEAKDRNVRGQGPRTQVQVFSEKKGFKILFQAISNS